MAEKTGEMYIEIGADAKKFHQEMTKVQKTGTKKMKTMAKDIAKAGAIAIAALTAVATGVVLAMGKATVDTIRAALAVDKFSKATGIATDDVQELIYAIEQEHGSAKALEKGLINITKALGDAEKGVKTYTDIFEDLGIEYRNHDGSLKDTMDIFDDLIEKMGEGELTTTEQAAAMKLLGSKIYVDLVPFLKLGKEEVGKLRQEAIDLGVVMSKDVVDSLKKTADSVDAIKSGFIGLRNLIVSKIAPGLETFTRTMKEAFILVRKKIDDIIPALGDLGRDTRKTADIGYDAAVLMVKSIFGVINAFQAMKTSFYATGLIIGEILDHTVGMFARWSLAIYRKVKIVTDAIRVLRGLPLIPDEGPENIRELSLVYGDFADVMRDKVTAAMDGLNLSGTTQDEILETLETSWLNFKEKIDEAGDAIDKTKDATKRAEDGMIKLTIQMKGAKKYGSYFTDGIKKLEILKDKTDDIKGRMKGLDTAIYIFGETMGEAFKKGKLGAEDFWKMLLKIAILLVSMNIPFIGPLVAGFAGALMGEGGVTIPKQSQPIYAAEGMAVAEKPTVSPGGNIYGDRGWEVFMKGHQWTEFIKSMRPTFLIHNYTNRDIVIEEIKGTSESGKYELARIMEDNILQKQRDLDK